jgi:hypothetical protein
MTWITYATEYDFTVLQNSDQSIPFAISNGAGPYILTGVTLTFYLKASNTATDLSGYSNNPTVTAALLGEFTVTIPRADLATSGTMFYHIDAASGSLIDTLAYGTVSILPI